MHIRALRDGDEPAVLDLLARSLGWSADASHAAYFRWKHRDSPFGPSPGWVAEDGGAIVGLRVFMRWEFTDGHRRYRAVRAVDTATHPEHRGRGVFRTLTMHALEALEAEGVDFVFNTPNAQSGPGYLKMGWREVGRLPVSLRLRSPMALPRLARSRVAAERAPLATTVGEAAPGRLEAAGDRLPPVEAGGALTTPRTPAFLRWRYGLAELGYRAWDAPGGGLVLFRLRRRGHTRELVVNDVLLGDAGGPRERATAVRQLLALTGADHALRLGDPGARGLPLVRRLGPVLLWRGLRTTEQPPLERWRLSMGDVELF